MAMSPSKERVSAGLNCTHLQRGHLRRTHKTLGSQSGHVMVPIYIRNILSMTACDRQRGCPSGRPRNKTPRQLCRELAQTRRYLPLRQECNCPVGGDAYKPVFFQFAFGSLHLDIFVGREPGAEAVYGRGTSFDVLA